MGNTLLPHLLGQQLTEELILPLFDDPIGLYGYKDYNGHILDLSPSCVHFLTALHFKNKKDIQFRSEYELIDNSKLVELYHSHDQSTYNGQTWSGIEPVHWKGEYRLTFVHKYPVYNKKSDIIGTFHYVNLINNLELFNFIEDLTQHQQNIHSQALPSFKIYAQDEKVSLTQREMECLFYSLRGKTAKEIGRLLNISQKTVEAHVEHIKHKFKCYSKPELISKAIELGYLEKIPQPILQKILA